MIGHAAHKPFPHFQTEDEFGNLHQADADDFITTFKRKIPPLLFLSGCSTGQSKDGIHIPSLAGELMKAGFPAVLAWAGRVYDKTALVAAVCLYRTLSEGATIPHALHQVYTELRDGRRGKSHQQWHLLRLYVYGNLSENLIQPGRYPKQLRQPSKDFLVVLGNSMKSRRIIQNCLNVIKTVQQKIGVVMYGKEGLNKNKLSARLCQRLQTNYNILALNMELNRETLLQLLYHQFAVARLIIKQNPQEELKYVLKQIFENQTSNKKLLLVITNLEQNAVINTDGKPLLRNNCMVLTSETTHCLKSIFWAIKAYDKNDYIPQIVLTSDYRFKLQNSSNILHFIYLE